MQDFLSHVLPTEGYYCAAIKAERGFKHIWTGTIAELARVIAECDQRGLTVYHACAAYKQAGTLWKGRRQSEVRALRSLWADVDCGEGKPYATALDGARAVVSFCTAAGLPLPIFVSSGYGVHCYWVLPHEVDPNTWRQYARGLRELCHQHGLQIDPARTADSASILRTPGTSNRKHADRTRPVHAGPLTGPIEAGILDRLLNAAATAPAEATRTVIKAGSVCADLYNYTGDAPDARIIAAGCEHFRRFLTEGSSRMPEPLWRDNCALASFTKQGNALAHSCSAADERFDATTGPAYIEDKIARYRANASGAPLCATFAQHDRATCERCPHFGQINSPIALGYGRRAELLAGVADPDVRDSGDRATSQPAPDGTNGPAERLTAPQLPRHYGWGPNNELVLQSSRDGKRVDYIVSYHPIYLDSVQVGEVNKEHQLVFKQFIPSEGWKEILVSQAVMQTGEAFAALGKGGGNVNDKKLFVDYVRAAIDLYYVNRKLLVNYEQYGWKENQTAFLFGEYLYTATGKVHISGNKELRQRSQGVGPALGYSLADWRERANKLFAKGTEAQAVALIASFAAPLIALLSKEGGVVLSLVTRESGRGKTMALTGASSVWGRKVMMELRRDFSLIARGITLATMGNIAVIFDELRARDPVLLSDFIKNFTEGGEKMRADREGALKYKMATWQTILITADNTSLIDLLSEHDDDDDPSALRIIEIPCEVPQDLRHVHGDRMKDELDSMSGWAGDAYLQWLLVPQNLESVKQLLRQVHDNIYKETGWDERYRFWVRGIAAIAVAGTIISQLGIVDFDLPRIYRWLIANCRERVRPRYTGSALNVLTRFLDESVGHRLVVDTPFVAKKRNLVFSKPMGRLSVRYEMSGRRYLISTQAWRAWCIENGLPWRATIEELCKTKVIIERNARLTLGAGTDYEGGQVWCMVVDGNHSSMVGLNPDLTNVVPLRSASSGANVPLQQAPSATPKTDQTDEP